MLNYSSIKIEIQESTVTGGSLNNNKKEKQSGATRTMAFENEEMILHVCNVSKLTLQQVSYDHCSFERNLSNCV